MKLKVISFNIRCIDDKDGHSVKERAPRLSKVIEPYAPDVMGFQEYTPLWESHIEEHFGEEYGIFNKYRASTGWIESAPILWRKDKFELVESGYFWLSDTPEVESRGWDSLPHNRMCEYVVLCSKESGEKFLFMNTHFGFGDECQTKSARLICEYARKLSDLPTFITGDFNMNPKSQGYAAITEYFTDVNAVTARDERSTYHGYDVNNNYDEHIDYCFVDKKIKPLAQIVIDTLVDGKFPSDHYGIYSEIEL